MTDRTQDDDSVLDNLDEVVDVVLGEGIAPDEPESPGERRQRILDSWTAIMLAIAAVAAVAVGVRLDAQGVLRRAARGRHDLAGGSSSWRGTSAKSLQQWPSRALTLPVPHCIATVEHMHRRPALTSRRHVDLGRLASQMCRMPGMRPCERP